MKSRLAFAVSSVFLLVVAGTANAQQTQQAQQPSGQATMQQDANTSAQSSTDTSYGGMPDTRSAKSSMRTRNCTTGPQCDIFFGQ